MAWIRITEKQIDTNVKIARVGLSLVAELNTYRVITMLFKGITVGMNPWTRFGVIVAGHACAMVVSAHVAKGFNRQLDDTYQTLKGIYKGSIALEDLAKARLETN